MLIDINGVMSYNKNTGEFLWKKNAGGRAYAGRPAGYKNLKGYVQLRLENRTWLAHRLAWVAVHGSIDPASQIDHINGDRADNRIENLRCVSGFVNQQNRHAAAKHNKTAMLGVGITPNGKKYTARITAFGKRYYIGSYATAEGASQAYAQKKDKLNQGLL
jgi:hypothetical protein